MNAAVPLDNQPPLALQQLIGELRGADAPRVRTALVTLSPGLVLQAPAWAASLSLELIHLGQAIAIQARAQSTSDIGLYHPNDLIAQVRRLLPHVDRHAPPPGGLWLCGFDLLLAKLSEAQRTTCWRSLREDLPYQPPLLVAMPAGLAARFGPSAAGWPSRRLAI